MLDAKLEDIAFSLVLGAVEVGEHGEDAGRREDEDDPDVAQDPEHPKIFKNDDAKVNGSAHRDRVSDARRAPVLKSSEVGNQT